MKSVLFLGHEYHKKTKSNQFFVDLLKKKYEVTCISFDPYEGKYIGEYDINKLYDLFILWQIIPSREEVDRLFKYKKGMLIPMYDSVVLNNNVDWINFGDFKVLCFCQKLLHILELRGFDVFYIQFFPPSAKKFVQGDKKSVFLWQRKELINIRLVEKLVECMDIKHIHIHKALDPQNVFITNMNTNYTITFSEWFENSNDYKKCVLESAIYIAPREYEGIGMGFLEAMAMGRCVIAPNYPTMNEYIEDGVNGILYDLNEIKPLKKYDILAIQKEAYIFSKRGYKNWLMRIEDMFSWIDTSVNAPIYSDFVVPEINKYEREISKLRRYNKILNLWLNLIEQGKNLEKYLSNRCYKVVAIYGMNDLGMHLYYELKKSIIDVKYCIDKNCKNMISDVHMNTIEEVLMNLEVDAVIVTAVSSFAEIKAEMTSISSISILSIEDILKEMDNQE